jgi:hypothetical protein
LFEKAPCAACDRNCDLSALSQVFCLKMQHVTEFCFLLSLGFALLQVTSCLKKLYVQHVTEIVVFEYELCKKVLVFVFPGMLFVFPGMIK